MSLKGWNTRENVNKHKQGKTRAFLILYCSFSGWKTRKDMKRHALVCLCSCRFQWFQVYLTVKFVNHGSDNLINHYLIKLVIIYFIQIYQEYPDIFPRSVTVSVGGRARAGLPCGSDSASIDLLEEEQWRHLRWNKRPSVRSWSKIGHPWHWSQHDSGIYICNAVNGFGSIHVALELKVISKNFHDGNVTSDMNPTMPTNGTTTTGNIVYLIRQMAREEFITETAHQMATEERRSEYIRQMSNEAPVSEPIHQMAEDDRQSGPIRQMTATSPQSEQYDHVATAFGVIVPLALVVVSIFVFVSIVLLVSLLILPRHGQLNESQRVASQESVIPPQEDLDQIDIPAPLPNPNWVLAGFFLHMAQNNIDSGYESASTEWMIEVKTLSNEQWSLQIKLLQRDWQYLSIFYIRIDAY